MGAGAGSVLKNGSSGRGVVRRAAPGSGLKAAGGGGDCPDSFSRRSRRVGASEVVVGGGRGAPGSVGVAAGALGGGVLLSRWVLRGWSGGISRSPGAGVSA